jgi:TolB protein
MNADGSDQRQLTNDAYDDGGGHVSPDSRYVVFISNRTGIFHIYRMDIDGDNLKQLTSGTEGGAAPFFSPDGQWVLYSANTGPGGGSSNNLSSWKVPADGGERISLSNDSWASAISPDGKLVVYLQRIRGRVLLWKLSILPFAGGPPLQTFDVTSESRPNSRWTPDGRAIIYNVTRGSVLSGVTNRGFNLAEGGILSGVTNLWLQPLDGGPPKQLTNFASEAFFSFDWSRDGKQLVCGRGSTTSDAVLISDFR